MHQFVLRVANPIEKIHQIEGALHFVNAIRDVFARRGDDVFAKYDKFGMFPEPSDDIIVLHYYMLFAKATHFIEVSAFDKQTLVAIAKCVDIESAKPGVCL